MQTLVSGVWCVIECAMRLFSTKNRPLHMGAYPMETQARQDICRIDHIPDSEPILFDRQDMPTSIVNALSEYQAMMDALRIGLVARKKADCPSDLEERARHIKSFGYFCDAAQMGIALMDAAAIRNSPSKNPHVARLAHDLRTRQTSTLAAGIDTTMADLRDSMSLPDPDMRCHTHAIVIAVGYPRDPKIGEVGCEWIHDAQAPRAALLANEVAVVLANYIRLLGFEATAHSASASDVYLDRLSVLAGVATWQKGALYHPYMGTRFGLGVVTTDFAMAPDHPLAVQQSHVRTHGVKWSLGMGLAKSRFANTAYARRRFVDGAYPFERIKRQEIPTTYIDEANVPRIPKRTSMFARAQFGDMGKKLQDETRNGRYVMKSPCAHAQRRILAAFILLQNAEPQGPLAKSAADPQKNAENIKAACYFLGADAVGLSRCPPWAYYSHNALGEPITKMQPNAISMVIDQGFETMDGASGDDWIAVSQSMRAYLRFSLLGGVIANQIRQLGYEARVHSVMDEEVLQPPLLLLSGLGEVSRIGEVILNPFLGPRLKSGVITTNMPMTYDKPIDFGLQNFCEHCNKCARECPSGAITAGPKRMFNGYEIWKSDSQKCATYRISTEGGAMCGRCMKTCPWNLEGVMAEKPVRWAAMHLPRLAPFLARLDDRLGRGGINPVKKWWWDIAQDDDGAYRPTRAPVNARALQPDLKVRYEDQTLAAYPANLAPHPWPFPYPMVREEGIAAYQALVCADTYRRGNGPNHSYAVQGDAPVLHVYISAVTKMNAHITHYTLASLDGSDLPVWEAGAHIDVAIAPGTMRQYSLCGDPENRKIYEIAVLRENNGQGGSKLLHRIFEQSRKIFIGKPINHFSLHEGDAPCVLMGGGIGITPLIAMAHTLHAQARQFRMLYSVSNRDSAVFWPQIVQSAWRDCAELCVSDEGTRLDAAAVFSLMAKDSMIYYCGPGNYMEAIGQECRASGFAEEQCRSEFFHVPEAPEYENHVFHLYIKERDERITVAPDQSAADALIAHGIPVSLKCSDGLCGVCSCRVVAGDVAHRDYVLSHKQRQNSMILCQSRAAKTDGEITISLPDTSLSSTTSRG
ncbi:MAG: reductive dehalogenase [Pseudomonadota bacterium]